MASNSETEAKLFAAIRNHLQTVEENTSANVLQKAGAIQTLALAYRYTAGGAQPGGADSK